MMRQMGSSLMKDWPLWIVLTAIVVFSYPTCVAPGVICDIDHGMIDAPRKFHAGEIAKKGFFPWWSPDLVAGFPILSESQTGVLYPFFLFHVFWDSHAVYTYGAVFHALVASAGMYFFLSSTCHIEKFLASFFAVGFAELVLAQGTGAFAPIQIYCWIPFVLILIDKGVRGCPWAGSAVAILHTLELLGGYPQMTLSAWLIAACYLVPFMFVMPFSRFVILFLECFAVPIVLGMVQLVPLIEYFQESNRMPGSASLAYNGANPFLLKNELGLLAGGTFLFVVNLCLNKRQNVVGLYLGELLGIFLGGENCQGLVQSVPLLNIFSWPEIFRFVFDLSDRLLMLLFLGNVIMLVGLALAPRWTGWNLSASFRGSASVVANLTKIVVLIFMAYLFNVSQLGSLCVSKTFLTAIESSAALVRPKADVFTRVWAIHWQGKYPVGDDRMPMDQRMIPVARLLKAEANLLAGIPTIEIGSTLYPLRVEQFLNLTRIQPDWRFLRAGGITHLTSIDDFPQGVIGIRLAWNSSSNRLELKRENGIVTGWNVADPLGQAPSAKSPCTVCLSPFSLRKDQTFQIRFRVRGNAKGELKIKLSDGSGTNSELSNVNVVTVKEAFAESHTVHLTARADARNASLVFEWPQQLSPLTVDQIVVETLGQTVDVVERTVNGFFERFEHKDFFLGKVRNSPGRAWMVHDARLSNQENHLPMMQNDDYDPARTVIVDRPVSLGPIPEKNGRVTFLRQNPDSLAMEVDTEGEGLLVVADRFEKNWVAKIDGVPTPILRANHLFRAVVIPAGKHVVEMWYWPMSVIISGVVSLVSFAVVVIRLAYLMLRGQGRIGLMPATVTS